MRHKKLNKRFGRNKSQRKQLLRSVVRSFFISYSIETTVEKAKEAKKIADNIITYAKSGTLNDIRAIERILQDRALISKIVKVIAPLSRDRKGGYTRIIRSGFRRGDGAELAILQLTDMPVKEEKQRKIKKTKPKASKEQVLEEVESAKALPEKQPGQIEKKEQSPKKEKNSLEQPPQAKAKKEEPAKGRDRDKKSRPEKPLQGKKDVLGRFRKFFRNKNQ